jgi:hypothetical protein
VIITIRIPSAKKRRSCMLNATRSTAYTMMTRPTREAVYAAYTARASHALHITILLRRRRSSQRVFFFVLNHIRRLSARVAQPLARVAAALLVEELLQPRAGAAHKRAPLVEGARSSRVERRVQCRIVAVRMLREERALLLVASIAYVQHALRVRRRAPDGRRPSGF